MPEALRGKGVISGIAIGKILLVGQSIDGYLADYKAGSEEVEIAKIENALKAVAEVLCGNVKTLQEKNMPEQAAIMEAHRMMAQDPMLGDSMREKVAELSSAPRAVLAAAEESAAMFSAMEDAYFQERAVDIRDVGKRIAKYILGVKEPELGDGAVILCGQEIEPSVIANIPNGKNRRGNPRPGQYDLPCGHHRKSESYSDRCRSWRQNRSDQRWRPGCYRWGNRRNRHCSIG